MSRIRSIKPEFFMDEEMSEQHPDAQLLFIGLWTLADRDGRLEDRPKRIKASVFPYRAVDVEKRLAELAAAGFIVRYEGAGKRLLAIRTFAEHQRPHPKETSFGFPPPPDGPAAPGPAPTSPGPTPVEPGSFTASREETRPGVDASRRVPPLVVVGDGGGSGDGDGLPSPAAPGGGEAPAPSTLFPEPTPRDVLALWNEAAHPDLPRCRELTPDREKAARARLKERGLDGPEGLRAVLERIGRSGFCRGRNDKGWRADVDWLLKPGTAARVLEGKYDDRAGLAAPKDVTRGVVRAEARAEGGAYVGHSFE